MPVPTDTAVVLLERVERFHQIAAMVVNQPSAGSVRRRLIRARDS